LLGSPPAQVEARLPRGLVTTMNAPLSAPNGVLSGVLFVALCIFLNSFFMLVTQPHWLRVWMFGKKETSLQVTSLSLTAIVWLILFFIGALASVVVMMAPPDVLPNIDSGDEVTIYFLQKVTETNPLYMVAFWLAGTAALFSTAAAHIYSFFLIIRFNLREG